MSTTPPTTEVRTTTGTGTDDRPCSGTTGTGRPDRWAAPMDEARGPSLTAPLAFDPLCNWRLRNCVDGENAAFPDAD